MLLPMPVNDMLDITKYRADEAGDKFATHWYREHVTGYLLLLFGASLYKKGADLWTKEPCGASASP